ncbi:hypothetical protein HY988_05790 [Candidatus Micrarchaeota archaeon]|nr:hypothetical protein [Candidatus Micrarchaeota archaeon]
MSLSQKHRAQQEMRTARVLLRNCPINEKLRGKEQITALDFGCGSGSSALGLAVALAGTYNVPKVKVYGVDLVHETDSVELQLGPTEVSVLLLRPYRLMHEDEIKFFKRFISLLGFRGFDFISYFNPGPPYEALDITKRAYAKATSVFYERGTITDKDLAEYTDEFSSYLIRRFGIDPKRIKNYTLIELMDFIRELTLVPPLKEIFPKLLSPDGTILIAADELTPPEIIRKTIIDSGYKLHFQGLNEEENINRGQDERQLGNKHLFIANLSEPK